MEKWLNGDYVFKLKCKTENVPYCHVLSFGKNVFINRPQNTRVQIDNFCILIINYIDGIHDYLKVAILYISLTYNKDYIHDP